jgi:imidazolonepropionase-like amidohydrolase
MILTRHMVKCKKMGNQNKHYSIRAKGMLCSGIDAWKTCLLSVKNGMIQSISDDLQRCSGDEIVDLADLTLSPCFCDYHLHFSERAKSMAESLGTLLLRFGINAAYEGGDKSLAGLAVKESLKGKQGIMTSGYALYKKGGYGSAIGRGVDSEAEAFSAINDLLACHVDYIKIIHSGVYEPESGLISGGGFEATELTHIVDYAKESGLDVYCHANGIKAVKEAIDAGVSAIVHGLYSGDEIFAEMAEKKVAFIPTVHAFQSLLADAKSSVARWNIEKTVDLHLSAVSRAFEHKVRVLPGSDSGPTFIPYGSAYIKELRLFSRAGISIENIIRFATTAVLTEGGPADFVLLDGLSVKQVVFRGQFLL